MINNELNSMQLSNLELNKKQSELPSVTVIIISKSNHAILEKAIESLSQIDYPRSHMQIIVLEETDTPQPFESWVEYHTIPMRHLGFGYARNKSLTYAVNSIIVFTDDDCTFKIDWLRKLVAPFIESEKISAVSGAVYVPKCGPVGQCENIIGFPGGGMRYVHRSGGKAILHPTFSTCNCAIRRSEIDTAGGFNETMKYGGEDEQLSRYIARNGSILYQPTAIVYHQPRNSIRAVFKWFVRRGYADVHHAIIENRSSYSLVKFFKNAVILRLMVLACISVLSGLGLILFCPVLLIYYCVLLYKFRWSLKYYPSIITLLMVPFVRTVMDAGRDFGIIKGLLTRKK
jgi:cellulose synthase/poly-beta-1,6-N-acetylglucosamine synthase-like glycosyltransferase